MGICSSCLGFGRRESSSDPSDTSHLLNDPYQPNQYGSINADHRNSPQVDPEEIRRQRDALERLCAQTSDKLIDVTQSANTEDGGASKMATDYQRLFSERFGSNLQEEERRPSSDSTLTEDDETTWLAHILKEDGSEILGWKASDRLGSLSVQFDEVLSPTDKGNGKSPRLQ